MSTLIGNTVYKDQFFTAASSYDQPRWVSLKEATKYITTELADKAMMKLIQNGNYQVRLVSLDEAMSFEMPDDSSQQDPSMDDVDVPIDNQESDEDMEAMDHEDVCPDCEHSPCTCEYGNEDELGDELGDELDTPVDGELEGELDDVPEETPEELDDDTDEKAFPRHIRRTRHEELPMEGAEAAFGHSFKKGQKVQYEGKPYTVVNDSGVGVVVISDDSNPLQKSRVISKDLSPITESDAISTIVQRITFSNPSSSGIDLEFGGDPDDEKVTVPANVKSALNDTIDMFTKAADAQKGVNDDNASFSMTVAGALTDLQNSLNLGTVAGIKQAQITLTTLMSPITSNIPGEVLTFIHRGGKKSSLQDLFNSKKNPEQYVTELSNTTLRSYQQKAIADVITKHKEGKDGKAATRIRKVAGSIQAMRDKKSGGAVGKHLPKPFLETLDAKSTYDVRIKQVQELLQQIGQELNNHAEEFAQDTESWAHPGDLAHIEAKLQEILSFIKGEDSAE